MIIEFHIELDKKHPYTSIYIYIFRSYLHKTCSRTIKGLTIHNNPPPYSPAPFSPLLFFVLSIPSANANHGVSFL